MSDPEHQVDEYIEPKPGARRFALLLFVGFGVAALAIREWLLPAFVAYMQALPICQGRWWVCVVLLSVCLVLLIVAIFLAWHGTRILRYGQIPFPGAKVFRRTKVQRGRTVRFMGYAALLIGLLVLPLDWHLTSNLLELSLFKPMKKCPTEFAFFGPDAPWAASSPSATENQQLR